MAKKKKESQVQEIIAILLEKAKKELEKELLPRKEKYDRLTPDRLNSAVWS